jgi:hypothetical protein
VNDRSDSNLTVDARVQQREERPQFEFIARKHPRSFFVRTHFANSEQTAKFFPFFASVFFASANIIEGVLLFSPALTGDRLACE